MSHPNIWAFLKKIIDEQARFEFIYEKNLSGDPCVPKKKKYKDYDDKLKSIVLKFDSITPLEYLKAIAHNIKIKTV